MLWLDKPDPSDDTGKILIEGLAEAFYTRDEILDLATKVGLEPGDILVDGTARRIWSALVRVADHSILHRLVSEASERKPASDKFQRVLAATVAGTASRYRALDPYQACLLGRGHRSALIDRSELRSELRRMITEQRPVLSVLGPTQAGKSYSLGFITHIGEELGYRVISIQIERHFWGDVTAVSMIKVLAQRLGLTLDLTGVDPHTTPTNLAIQLVNILTGLYPSDEVRRLIVIDGLDREVVKNEVHDLVTRIADEIALGQLARTQLVVTGYDGLFSSDVNPELLTERIGDISQAHVRLFFERIFKDMGQTPDHDVVSDLVRKVMKGTRLNDRRRLGIRARDVAHEHWKAFV